MRKEGKRGQVTLFVIIAIVIVAIIVGFFLFKDKLNMSNENPQIPKDVQPVYDFVASCIEKTGEEALQYVGLHGGYSALPLEVPILESKIPYYVYNNKSYMPTNYFIEGQISSFIVAKLPDCINNFNSLSGFEIKSSNSNINTRIDEQQVTFNVDYPLSIKKSSSTYSLKNFKELKIPVRLGFILNVTNFIIADQVYHTNTLAFGYLDALGKGTNLTIEAVNYGNDSIIFTISDSLLKINNTDYKLLFANQYLW